MWGQASRSVYDHAYSLVYIPTVRQVQDQVCDLVIIHETYPSY
jgi:hypothetical protein